MTDLLFSWCSVLCDWGARKFLYNINVKIEFNEKTKYFMKNDTEQQNRSSLSLNYYKCILWLIYVTIKFGNVLFTVAYSRYIG